MQYGAPQPGYGQAPPMQQGYGAPAPQSGPRCQMGHDIAPGASYCAMGHPIAMDAMPFGQGAADPYGGGGGYGQPSQQQPQGFGAPQQGGFGAPQQGGFGAPMQQPGAPGGYYGQDPSGYGQQSSPFGAPQGQPPQQGGFGPPQGAPPPQFPGMPGGGGYDASPQPGGFGNQGGSQPAFPAAGFGAPAASPGFGAQPGGFGQPSPPMGQPAPMGGPGMGGPAMGGAPMGAAPAPQAPPLPPAIPDQLPAQALRGFLVSYQTNTTGDFWPLHGGRKTVGRANSGESVDIALSDATISSRHAAVNIDGTSGVVTVEDTGSTNGTFVNEEHIGFNGRRDLRDGDRVRFGGYTVIAKIVSR